MTLHVIVCSSTKKSFQSDFVLISRKKWSCHKNFCISCGCIVHSCTQAVVGSYRRQ